MSNQDIQNKNSNSDTPSGQTKTSTEEKVAAWTTWEELLLACAVKRHGIKDWDAVAMELQTRSTAALPPSLLTPQICRDKFQDLQRRFTSNDNADGDDVAPDEDDDVTVPWLEELRKLRVAELRQEVHRYDLSIQSLQMKAKRMEDERERSLKESEPQNDGEKQTDLEKDNKNDKNNISNSANLIKEEAERSENDKKGGETPPEDAAGKEPSGEDENRSVNESNSTGNRGTGAGSKGEPETVEVKPETKPAGEEDSCNDSSDRHNGAGKKSQEGKVDSVELRGESVEESKEAGTTKESSDVQSTASLTRKRRRRGGEDGGGKGRGSGGEGNSSGRRRAALEALPVAMAEKKRERLVKSEPLVSFLDVIRSHKHGSLFERRLDAQKTDKYKNMIRRHVDLQKVQTRIDDGSYSSCSNRFYLDLLLLFNNAIVFFSKSSPESKAAHQLRGVVMKEIMKNRTPAESLPESTSVKMRPKPEPDRPDSLLAKHKSTAPLVVCRKRSSIAAKASSSATKAEKQPDKKPLLNTKPPVKSSSSNINEDDTLIKIKLKEKPVTGVRSMRRSSKGRSNNKPAQSNPSSNQNTSSSSQQPSSAQKAEDANTDKKKPEPSNAAKKRGAADFLKRIKKNSPAKGSLIEALKSTADDSSSKGGKSDQRPKKVEERKDGGPVRRSGGGRQTKDDNSPSKRNQGRPPKKGKEAPAAAKRGRETNEGEGSSKRPNKRTRR